MIPALAPALTLVIRALRADTPPRLREPRTSSACISRKAPLSSSASSLAETIRTQRAVESMAIC